MRINNLIRIDCIHRKLTFNFALNIGFFWIAERLTFLQIKEPWNKLYKRQKAHYK